MPYTLTSFGRYPTSGTAHRSCTFAAPLLAERSAHTILVTSPKWSAMQHIKCRSFPAASYENRRIEMVKKRGFLYDVGCPVPTSSSISMLPLDNVPTVTLFSCPKARKIFFCFRKTAVCRNTQAGIRKTFPLLRFSTERTSLKGLLLLPRPQ